MEGWLPAVSSGVSNPIQGLCLPKAPPPSIITLEDRFQHVNLAGGNTNIQSVTVANFSKISKPAHIKNTFAITYSMHLWWSVFVSWTLILVNLMPILLRQSTILPWLESVSFFLIFIIELCTPLCGSLIFQDLSHQFCLQWALIPRCLSIKLRVLQKGKAI